MSRNTISINVECSDVLKYDGDVLALKHSQHLFGVDRVVADRLESAGLLSQDQLPEPASFRMFPSNGTISASAVLFTGTVAWEQFGYAEIREFARRTLENLADSAPDTESLLVTLHGAGFGLDEIEALESEVAGFFEAISAGHFPDSLQSIKIVELNRERAKLLKAALRALLPDNVIPVPGSSSPAHISNRSADRLRSVGYDSKSKPFVFVAMPFADEMNDVFRYGIHDPVKAANFLCERADKLSFTGDIMERVKNRIEHASFVVADLTGANPNVYLEIGYAWGVRQPTILLVKKSDSLEFNVRGQRCLVYTSIEDLEAQLTAELANLGGL